MSLILCPWLLASSVIHWSWPDKVAVATLVAWFVSNALSADIFRALEASGRVFVDCFTPYLLGRFIALNRSRLRKALTFLAGLMTLGAVLVVIESFAEWNVHQVFWGNITPVGTVFDEKRLELTRAMGWTSHPIMLGLAYGTLLPVVMQDALHGTRWTGKFAWIKTAATLAALFLSLSSGAWILGALAMGLLIVDRMPALAARVKWSAVFVGAPLMYAALEGLANRPLLRILMMKLHLSSPMAWYYRWRLYERVYASMPGYWWLGHGLAIPEEFARTSGWSVDNQYLCLLLLHGYVGMIMWILAMAAVFFHNSKIVWMGPDTDLVRLTRAIRIAILASSLAQLSVALFSTANILLWLFMGLAVGLGQLCVLERDQPNAVRRLVRIVRPA
jgi:hypothetical protein